MENANTESDKKSVDLRQWGAGSSSSCLEELLEPLWTPALLFTGQ